MTSTTFEQDMQALHDLHVSMLSKANQRSGDARLVALQALLSRCAGGAASCLCLATEGDHEQLALLTQTFAVMVEETAARIAPEFAAGFARGEL